MNDGRAAVEAAGEVVGGVLPGVEAFDVPSPARLVSSVRGLSESQPLSR